MFDKIYLQVNNSKLNVKKLYLIFYKTIKYYATKLLNIFISKLRNYLFVLLEI